MSDARSGLCDSVVIDNDDDEDDDEAEEDDDEDARLFVIALAF